MGRPPTTSLERFRNRFWAYQLFQSILREQDAGTFLHPEPLHLTWASLERLLMDSSSKGMSASGRLQALGGVVRRGRDPRRAVRLIPARDWISVGPEVPQRLHRRRQRGEKIDYFVVPIDLVQRGEELCPGSSAWYDAPLWDLLATPSISPTDIVKITEELLQNEGLFRSGLPSPSFSSPNAIDMSTYVFREATEIEMPIDLCDRYIANLGPLTASPTASGFSLLVSLLVESCLVGIDLVFELHSKLVAEAIEGICSKEPLAELAGELSDVVFEGVSAIVDSNLPTIPVMSLAFPILKSH